MNGGCESSGVGAIVASLLASGDGAGKGGRGVLMDATVAGVDGRAGGGDGSPRARARTRRVKLAECFTRAGDKGGVDPAEAPLRECDRVCDWECERIRRDVDGTGGDDARAAGDVEARLGERRPSSAPVLTLGTTPRSCGDVGEAGEVAARRALVSVKAATQASRSASLSALSSWGEPARPEVLMRMQKGGTKSSEPGMASPSGTVVVAVATAPSKGTDSRRRQSDP